MLTFEEFSKQVAEDIASYLPADAAGYSVNVHEVDKVNIGTRKGLSIHRSDEMGGPVFYLDDLYEEFSHMDIPIGEFMEYLSDRVVSERIGTMRDSVIGAARNVLEFDWELVKDRIHVSAIGASMNQALLEKIPHRQVGDVCAVYRIAIGDNENIRATVMVTNEIMQRMGVSPELLHETAVKNSVRDNPAVCMPLGEVLSDLLGDEGMREPMPGFRSPLYVLTNRNKMDGAGVIFYPQIPEMLYRNIPENYYLIPSSIHEWLVVSKNEVSKDYLEDMVAAVNEGEVDIRERLSYMVHEYEPDRKIVFAGECPPIPELKTEMEKGKAI